MTTLPELSQLTQQARATLARILTDLDKTRHAAREVESRIDAGDGLNDPALFGNLRNLLDLAGWLDAQLPDARLAVQRAEEDEQATRDRIRATRAELDKLLAGADAERAQKDELRTAAVRIGDTRSLDYIDAKQAIYDARVRACVETLAALGESATA